MSENWLLSISKAGLPILKKSLFQKSEIAEISISQGQFSSPFLSLLPENAYLFRTDYPKQDYNDLWHPTIPTQYVPGSIFRQLYPKSSKDLIYAFSVFNTLSQNFYASDHLFTTLTKIEAIQKKIDFHQDIDLSFILEKRYKELKIRGEIVFDLFLPPEPSEEPHSWDVLDFAVQLSLDIFPVNLRNRLNLQTYFRSPSQISKILKHFEKKFEILDMEKYSVEMPAYSEFLQHKNLEKYVNELCKFWKFPIYMMILRNSQGKLSNSEIEMVLEKVFEKFREICKDFAPKAIQDVTYIRLVKISECD